MQRQYFTWLRYSDSEAVGSSAVNPFVDAGDYHQWVSERKRFERRGGKKSAK